MKLVLVPAEPIPEMLACIVHDDYPADYEAGKQLQRERGLEVVPPKTEYEIAVGQYQRLLAAAPPLTAEMVDEISRAMWSARWFWEADCDNDPPHRQSQICREEQRARMRAFLSHLGCKIEASHE